MARRKPRSRSERRPRELRGLPLAGELEAYDLPRLERLAERAMARNRERLNENPRAEVTEEPPAGLPLG